jgi:hypothetical protein
LESSTININENLALYKKWGEEGDYSVNYLWGSCQTSALNWMQDIHLEWGPNMGLQLAKYTLWKEVIPVHYTPIETWSWSGSSTKGVNWQSWRFGEKWYWYATIETCSWSGN